jgi:hypothetical protein
MKKIQFGFYGLTSLCNGHISKHYYYKEKDVREAKATLDKIGCGGNCTNRHKMDLDGVEFK